MLNVIYSSLLYHILMFHHHIKIPVFHHLSAFAEPLTVTDLLPFYSFAFARIIQLESEYVAF